MSRPNSVLVSHRASERLSAGAAALAVTLLMMLSVDALAAESVQPPRVAVQYSEMSFGTAAGTAAVYSKLKHAARSVCGLGYGVSQPLGRDRAAQKCFDEALADAVRRIDRPMLTSVHSASTRNLG